jgi:hypothetical protein
MTPAPLTRKSLLESIAYRIADYRQGEIAPRTPDDIDRWVGQFDADVQDAMLAEMDHVLKQSYLSRAYFLNFLRGLVSLNRLIGGNDFWLLLRTAFARLIDFVIHRTAKGKPCPRHWRDVHLLQIQKHGASQQEMVRLLQEVLRQDYGLSLASSGPTKGPFLYLDDVLFTGNRIIADLVRWIRTDAPPRADLLIVVIALYRRGFWYTQKIILQAAADARKAIRLHWLRSVEFEDRHWVAAARDGFHPTLLPNDPLAHAYARQLAEARSYPRFRVPPAPSHSCLFSSEAGRHLLEQQLLLAGLKIRSFYRNPQEVMRPLGYHMLKDLGFGATLVTYRNCPNNCPLAWWWDTSALPFSRARGRWYPLFPRKV